MSRRKVYAIYNKTTGKWWGHINERTGWTDDQDNASLFVNHHYAKKSTEVFNNRGEGLLEIVTFILIESNRENS